MRDVANSVSMRKSTARTWTSEIAGQKGHTPVVDLASFDLILELLLLWGFGEPCLCKLHAFDKREAFHLHGKCRDREFIVGQ